MNRRDTIIIAVLINTGLLAALFMMAIHIEVPETFNRTETIVELSDPAAVNKNPPRVFESRKEEVLVASRDEIDEVLKNYSDHNSRVSVMESHPPKEASNVFVGDTVQVKVKKGDFLEKIARANGTTVSAILQANQMSNERIAVGQILLIPVSKKTESREKASQQTSSQEIAANEPQYYTIKSGDNPWKIAKQFHVKMDELLSLNNLDEAKARNLKPGDVLRVR